MKIPFSTTSLANLKLVIILAGIGAGSLFIINNWVVFKESFQAANFSMLLAGIFFTKLFLALALYLLLARNETAINFGKSIDLTIFPDLAKYIGSGVFGMVSKYLLLKKTIDRDTNRMFLLENILLVLSSLGSGFLFFCIFENVFVLAGVSFVATILLMHLAILVTAIEINSFLFSVKIFLVFFAANIALGLSMWAVFPEQPEFLLIFSSFAFARSLSYVSIVLPAGLIVREVVMWWFLSPLIQFDELISILICYRILVAFSELSISVVWAMLKFVKDPLFKFLRI